MNDDVQRGPGGLPLHEAGVDPSRLNFTGGPAAWTRLPAMGLREFVDSYLDGETPARMCILLDAPHRTATRVAAALACARDLLARGRSVALVDGDDQRPDLSAWAGRSDTEGWVDMVRYGISPAAAGAPLPWEPGEGRVLGVGSYHPVRAEAGEATALVERLLAEVDTVLICASTGDRGAYWAELEALRVICWDRAGVDAGEVALLVRDAADLGAPIALTLAFGASPPMDVGAFEVSETEPPRHSSPLFRRLAILMAVLVVVLGSWFLGQLVRRETPPLDMPADVETPTVALVADTTARDTTGTGPAVADAEPDMPQEISALLEPPEFATSEARETDEPGTEATPDTTMTDWRRPVTEGAYCLHVYSMADSLAAAEQLRWMERRGVSGLVRRWRDVDEKTWYRIYAGSFATPAEARAAMPDLFERLDTDWALPKRTARIR